MYLFIGYWLLVIGYWLLVIGYWLLDVQSRLFCFFQYLFIFMINNARVFFVRKIV
jgi:hypothetical protein